MQGHSTTREIILNNGDRTIVDAADYDWLNQWKWSARKGSHTTYVQRRNPETKSTEYMHRLIMGAEKGQEVDHIDRNGLNNTRANLRLATSSQNKINQRLRRVNTSGYRGVYWHRRGKKWAAQIWVDKEVRYLGLFVGKEEAAKAYDAAAKQYHGEYAQLNFG